MTLQELETARRLVAHFQPYAHRAGYNLALYGSTLTKGQGNDIDLYAIPWVFRPIENQLISEFAYEGFRITDRYKGVIGTHSYQLVRTYPDQKQIIVDLVVVPSPSEIPALHDFMTTTDRE